jgi:hypothetical protein
MSDLGCSIKLAKKKDDGRKDPNQQVVQKSTPDWEIDGFTRKLPATDPLFSCQHSICTQHHNKQALFYHIHG